MRGSRPSASSPARVRLPRSLSEFMGVPLLVVAALLLLAVASIYGDQGHGPVLTSLRSSIGHLIGKKAAQGTLSAVATGLVTVTSITFSVLLLAVQQTASNLSPVVFDQFVRRRTNQVFLGLFVGLALYAYVVLAAVQESTPPIIGAFLATVLTIVALSCLLFLVYSTINQMRPRNVMRQLHDRAVLAHDRETSLITRTRRSAVSGLPVLAELRSDTFGYVESIDLDVLAASLEGTWHRPEVEVHVTIGSEVAFGDLIASVRAVHGRTAKSIRAAVAKAITFSSAPDLDLDATTGIRDLRNIGWTSGSTSKQNPAVAAQALHAVRDLAVRWLDEGDRTGPDPLPVVYADDDVDTVLDALYDAAVVAHESHQHDEAAHVLDIYRTVLDHASGAVADRIRRDLDAMTPLLDQMPTSPALDRARRRLRGEARPAGSSRTVRDTSGVRTDAVRSQR